MAKDFLTVDKGLKHKKESAAISYAAANEGTIYNENDSKMHVQIAGADRELINDSQAQSLSNKHIDSDLNQIINIVNADIKAAAGIVESKLALDYSTASLSSSIASNSGNLASHIASNSQHGLVAATVNGHIAASSGVHGLVGALVGLTDAQSLTNKTIDSDLNNIINIVNADIKAAAGIIESKLALDYSTASLSSSIASNSGTLAGHIAATSAHGVAGAIVGTSDTQTLSNKSLVDNSTLIVDNTDPTKQIGFDAAGTAGTKTTIASSQTVARTITLPDETDTLSTQTNARAQAIKYAIALG